jgi:hypothetical protein
MIFITGKGGSRKNLHSSEVTCNSLAAKAIISTFFPASSQVAKHSVGRVVPYAANNNLITPYNFNRCSLFLDYDSFDDMYNKLNAKPSESQTFIRNFYNHSIKLKGLKVQDGVLTPNRKNDHDFSSPWVELVTEEGRNVLVRCTYSAVFQLIFKDETSGNIDAVCALLLRCGQKGNTKYDTRFIEIVDSFITPSFFATDTRISLPDVTPFIAVEGCSKLAEISRYTPNRLSKNFLALKTYENDIKTILGSLKAAGVLQFDDSALGPLHAKCVNGFRNALSLADEDIVNSILTRFDFDYIFDSLLPLSFVKSSGGLAAGGINTSLFNLATLTTLKKGFFLTPSESVIKNVETMYPLLSGAFYAAHTGNKIEAPSYYTHRYHNRSRLYFFNYVLDSNVHTDIRCRLHHPDPVYDVITVHFEQLSKDGEWVKFATGGVALSRFVDILPLETQPDVTNQISSELEELPSPEYAEIEVVKPGIDAYSLMQYLQLVPASGNSNNSGHQMLNTPRIII